MSDQLNFTKRTLEALPVTGAQYVVKDKKTMGLILLVSQKGTKTFYLRRKINGRDERVRIGRFPEWTVEQAQERVTELNAAINKGGNPNEVKRSIREEPTFSQVFEQYLRDKRKRSGEPLSTRTKEEYRKVINTHLPSVMNRKLSELKPDTIKRIHAGIESPAQANKIKAVLSAVYRWAVDESITSQPPPVKGIKTKLIKERERFLQPSEVKRFMEAIDASPQRDYFLLALMTGARRDNVLSMRWAEIDLRESTWRIPKTKNGEAQTIPLPPGAVEILKERKAQKIISATWVFPGTPKPGHPIRAMHQPRRAWDAVLKAAQLDEHLRFHDLRRTLGSWQARQGSSLSIIGRTLGHKSQQATRIYARLDLDPIRAAQESAVAAILDEAKKK